MAKVKERWGGVVRAGAARQWQEIVAWWWWWRVWRGCGEREGGGESKSGAVAAEGGMLVGAERMMANVETGGEMWEQGVWERAGKSGEESGWWLGCRGQWKTARWWGQAARQPRGERVGWPWAREHGGEGWRERRKQMAPVGVDSGASEADGKAAGTGGEAAGTGSTAAGTGGKAVGTGSKAVGTGSEAVGTGGEVT